MKPETNSVELDRITIINRMYGGSPPEVAQSQPQEKMQKMRFRNEAEVRKAISVWLEERGERPQKELETPGGRIDLLSSKYIVEVKRELSRHNLLQAVGQVMSESPYAPGRIKVVAGLSPEKDQERVYDIAKSLRKAGIQVWFVDQGDDFLSCVEQTDSVEPESTDSTESENNEMPIFSILDRINETASKYEDVPEIPSDTDESLAICIEYLCDRMLANEDRIAKLEAR